MTTLPAETKVKLGLVIDLETCVGCHACVVNCKEWNTGGEYAPLSDVEPYGKDVLGAWLNRVHTYEVSEGESSRTVHFPKSCLHCDDAPCVTACPTGASYKREEDGIVLVNEDACIGCGLCAWACPYGAREMDPVEKVMKKCTLCVDRIYNETLPQEDRTPACVRTCPAEARHFGDLNDPSSKVSKMVAERGGVALMEEQGTRPVNRYLRPRRKDSLQTLGRRSAYRDAALENELQGVEDSPEVRGVEYRSSFSRSVGEPEVAGGLLGWLDRTLEKLG